MDTRDTENWIKGEEAAFMCNTDFSMSMVMDVTGWGGTLQMTHRPTIRVWKALNTFECSDAVE